MNSDQSLKNKLNSDIDNFKEFAKLLQTIHDNEKNLNEDRIKAFTDMAKIQELDNQILRDIYSNFSGIMQGLEKDRNTFFIDELNLKLIPITYFYPDDIKKIQKTMSEIDDIQKQIKKDEESKAKTKPEDKAKSESLNKDIIDKKAEEKKKNKSCISDLCKYEIERVRDTKSLLLHYIFSEMKFHAQSLQQISELFHKINEMEPLENIEDFRKKMNINTDLKDCGIDMAKINRHKDIRQMNERNNAKKVFDSQEL